MALRPPRRRTTYEKRSSCPPAPSREEKGSHLCKLIVGLQPPFSVMKGTMVMTA